MALNPDERWIVDDDAGPGMRWNRHILNAGDTNQRVAFMAHSNGRDDEGDEGRAYLIAAAPMLLAALEQLIEDAQPDNWDDGDDPGQAAAWRAAFRAMLTAKNLPIPENMKD